LGDHDHKSVFAYPGISSTLVVAVGNRDLTLVMSVRC
jgi:ABC-type dipeptide/oligopeptide/nickel transport system permease component